MIIPVGYGQVNFIYTGANVPNGAQWTLGIDLDGFPGDPATAADVIAVNYDEADIESVIATFVDLVGILVKYGPTETGPSALKSFSVPSDGGASTENPSTSTLIRKQTALGGRRGRGRFYLPTPPVGGLVGGGNLNSTFQTQVQDRFDDFYDKMVADSLQPVVLHGAGQTATPVPTPITSFVVDSRIGNQRRRNR